MSDADTQNDLGPDWLRADAPEAMIGALILAWSHRQPDRVGEVGFVPAAATLGRGEVDGPRVRFVRSRPGREEDRGPLDSPSISRVQLELEPRGEQLAVRCVGRCPMRIDGVPCSEGVLSPGSTLELQNEIVLLYTWRVRSISAPVGVPMHPFGGPDPHGLVGESPAAWALRERVRFATETDGHVLVLGDSGTGKELVARALHQSGDRHAAPFVSRNAATIPESIVDAELFGHARNYPNPGMPEREGLIGEARHGTLFLDEIGCLRADLQAHLLRLLDEEGEYTRLGESRARRSDVRVVAATNSSPTELKQDFLARFRIQLEVPDLSTRREDIPLIARHLLQRAAREPQLRERFFDERGEARMAPAFVVALLQHDFALNIRELDTLLWASMQLTSATFLDTPPALHPPPDPEPDAERAPTHAKAHQLDAAAVCRMLDRCDNNITESARQLGLPSRYALYRLMRKLDITRP